MLIAHSSDEAAFEALRKIVGNISGEIAGLFTPVDAEYPYADKVAWAEALRVSIDMVNGRCWLLLDPDVWIWPNRARRNAAEFLDERRGGRYNKIYNGLMDAWLAVLSGDAAPKCEIKIPLMRKGTLAETPSFTIGTRTAYTRRLAS